MKEQYEEVPEINPYDEDADIDEGIINVKKENSEPFEFQEVDDIDGGPISEEDSWTVIAAHFQERGLVGQQLDSFDFFMTTTMQVSTEASLS